MATSRAHAIHRSAPANGQIRHVETLRRVARILGPRGQQTVEMDAEIVLGIAAEVLLDQSPREAIEAGGHCRVGGEQLPRLRNGQRHVKGLRCLQHETAGSLQHREGRMTLIEVTDFRLDAKFGKQPPTADSELAELALDVLLRFFLLGVVEDLVGVAELHQVARPAAYFRMP